MNNALLVAFAEGLAGSGVACMRFNFPFSEKKRRSPDSAAVLSATWALALEVAKGRASRVWVGGKSMGGRYASMMVAQGAEVDGLIFLGYPLHAAGRTEKLRSDHWSKIKVPALFIQGTSDPMAKWDLLNKELKKMPNARIHPVEGGGHSFEVRGSKSSPRSTAAPLAKVAANFILENS